MRLLNTSSSDEKSISQQNLALCEEAYTEFSDWENLTLSGGVELDRALRWVARRFSKAALTNHTLDIDIASLQKALKHYQSVRPDKHRNKFFPYPKSIPQVTLSSPHKLSVGEVVDLTFSSSFRPSYKPFRKEFLEYEENLTVHARMWRHPPGTSLGNVVAIHGWFMGDQRINALALVPGFFYRLGLDVILYELPYHGRRAPASNGDSKTLFPSFHIARTNEAVAQAVYDLRALTKWLNSENEKPVGVVGMSLGGYVAALWSCLDPLNFVIPMVPLVSMAEVAWELLGKIEMDLSKKEKTVLQRITLDTLQRVYAIHDPLNYEPQVPHEGRLIVAGLKDAIIPPDQPSALWEHWNKPRIHWFSGGHLKQMSESQAFAEVHDFLLSLHLAHREPLEIKSN